MKQYEMARKHCNNVPILRETYKQLSLSISEDVIAEECKTATLTTIPK